MSSKKNIFSISPDLEKSACGEAGTHTHADRTSRHSVIPFARLTNGKQRMGMSGRQSEIGSAKLVFARVVAMRYDPVKRHLVHMFYSSSRCITSSISLSTSSV